MEVKNYNPLLSEQKTIEYWKENQIYKRIKERNTGKEKFYFLQGPPYTSGKLHMGHAWNNTLKDAILRYKRMKGFDVWDRGGYDMHGLPTELKVQAKFNLETKEDIIEFGEEKFAEECEKWSIEKANDMTTDLWRLGVWMDHDNAYMPIKNTFMENEWWLIKTAYEKGRVYEGKKTISWCSSCATALAKHECEYKELNEKSIFVKFKIKEKDNEYLIIWTTTPWTIAFNMAIMVNPEIDYVKVKIDNEIWIVAKQLAGPLIRMVVNKPLKIIEEFKGDVLEEMEYIHPWESEIPYFIETKKEFPKTHTVIMSNEFVDTTAGSGLVHCAPGCGPEDYEIGHRNNIPAFNNISEKGIFPEDMGKFSGLKAKTDDKKFIEALDTSNALIAITDVAHDYAHCWRCKHPVIFRATKQWFFKIEDLKEQMIEANKCVQWVPSEGSNALELWTKNLRDDSITKQRFWGTPVPIWKCDKCEDVTVIASAKELEELGAKVPLNLHKPWIDRIVLNCKCGGKKIRLPDVLDVWIDAGTVAWNCLDYPNRTDLMNKWWPADFILEAKEQTRLWFSMLLKCSMLAMDQPCYKNVYMHGMLLGVDGVKMSKSLGNVISPYEITDKYGADTLRYYLNSVNAGENINFSWDEIKLKYRNLTVFWNLHKYLLDFSSEIGKIPLNLSPGLEDIFEVEEKYIISKLNNTIKNVTLAFDEYRLDDVPNLIENLYLELSRTYIQQIREKVTLGTEKEKEVVLYTIYKVMNDLIKISSPFFPFITETIFLNFKKSFNLTKESVHMYEWPNYTQASIDEELETNMLISQSIIQSILSAREKAQIGLRWPVKEVIIECDGQFIKSIKKMQKTIKVQTNIKTLLINSNLPELNIEIEPNHQKLGPEFGAITPKIIEYLKTINGNKLLAEIKTKGKHIFKINDKELELRESHIKIEKQVPEPYILSEFKQGHIYLNQERDTELNNEGFAREITRRIQQARKEKGLIKSDSIKLYIKTSMSEELNNWLEQIQLKVGAENIVISNDEPQEIYKNTFVEKIKDQEIIILFNKE